MEDEQEDKQTINCTVESCVHNDNENEKCELEEITVEPPTDAASESGEPEDESMCGDYEEAEEQANEAVNEPADTTVGGGEEGE